VFGTSLMAVIAMFWLCDKAARFLKYIMKARERQRNRNWIFSPVNPIVWRITHTPTRSEYEDHFWGSSLCRTGSRPKSSLATRCITADIFDAVMFRTVRA
jgi:hypothetical protein